MQIWIAEWGRATWVWLWKVVVLEFGVVAREAEAVEHRGAIECAFTDLHVN
jgi:hypothetical protein